MKMRGVSSEAEGGFSADPILPLPGKGTDAGDTLQKAHDAFVAGDYAKVRELTESLRSAEGDVKLAADTLRRRVSVDPMQVSVLLACTAFFFFIVWKYVL
ncbi:MAG: hypothetical protein AAF411_03640 [Myxococcota bacterium]